MPTSFLRDERCPGYSRDVNAEFNWWLLIVGLVVGAGLVWLVVADSRRREADVSELEREGEARWIADAMSDAGRRVDEADVLDILRLHAAYLAAAPPEEPDDDALDDPSGGVTDRAGTTGASEAPFADDRTAADDRRWVPVPETPAASESTVNRR